MTGKKPRIAVVGAGIIGLTTATLFQEAVPNSEVTIIADKFLRDTTSDGAAGIFRPGLHFFGPTHDITMKWLKDSYIFYDNLIKEIDSPENAASIGLIRRKSYILSTKFEDDAENFYLESVVGDFRRLSDFEIRTMFKEDDYKYGSTFTSMIAECTKYQPYLTRKFQSKGGNIVTKKLESFEELCDLYDLVFNCSGIGSSKLCNDKRLTPIRGQVYKVRAPWIKDALYVDSDTYIIPGTDGLVTLGGTRQFSSTNVDVDKHDSAKILEKCIKAVPSLTNAKIEKEWVGFRPYRTEVRVESEEMTFNGRRSIKVIHNYGHGGYGVMSAPGTSMHAVLLGVNALNEMMRSKL